MVEIVVAGADQQRRPLADAAEVFLHDDRLRRAADRGRGIEMVAGQHHDVDLRRRRHHPVELAQIVVQVGDQQAFHRSQP